MFLCVASSNGFTGGTQHRLSAPFSVTSPGGRLVILHTAKQTEEESKTKQGQKHSKHLRGSHTVAEVV